MSTNHYDVIIIGSGAGGGTLALKLAPSGKRILVDIMVNNAGETASYMTATTVFADGGLMQSSPGL